MIVRRNCYEVILKMLTHVPEENTEFIAALQWNYEDSLYKAPEENLQWLRTQRTLEKYIPKPVDDWHFEVLSIFTTRSIDKLKSMIDAQ